MHVLITGVAGFIGYHLAMRLLAAGHQVVGVDNCNNYYDVNLKKDRLKRISSSKYIKNFQFFAIDISDTKNINELFAKNKFTHVVNLAAQAGVRYSIENPRAYLDSNVIGFGNILECCRNFPVEHLLFASSSSVYGINSSQKYSVSQNTDHPASIYAATKKSNELMAYSYSYLFKIPATGLRLFTVYGPWGRPDMALHLFTTAILHDQPLKVFNAGKMLRDFTYIDDVIETIIRILPLQPSLQQKVSHDELSSADSYVPYRLYNIGNSHPIELMEFIETIEKVLGKKAKKEMLPMQPGDVQATWADIEETVQATNFTPKTSLYDGIAEFVRWYQEYYC
ncbi:MAG: GDP-mannose 4,6-dehydratase [Desulfovibrio sp.]|nr:GDP-mannose 4,6-dehydratase [Desulfovibrio sp.]